MLKSTGHETYRGFVTVPLTGLDGETTGIHGLRIDPTSKTENVITIGNGLFNAAALRTCAEIIVCGSVLDAWTFYAAGHTGAIAAAGWQLKQEHFVNTKRVLLAYPTEDYEPFQNVER